MSQDHYIARTYLKHWTDTQNRKLLYAYRKSDLKEFPCKPADVCREWNGDLNEKYFKKNPAILGQLRTIFEKDWNKAIEQLTKKLLTREVSQFEFFDCSSAPFGTVLREVREET